MAYTSIGILRRGLSVIVAGVLLAAVGVATAAESWDGTWAGGWEKGDGVQIIIAGDKVVGVFRGGDYPDVQRSELSTDRKVLTFAWASGNGTLQRAGERDATFTLRERSGIDRSFTVHRE